MKLRAFALITTLALSLLAAPLPAEAQRAGKVWRVGVLRPSFSGIRMSGSAGYPFPWLAEFGYIAGENIQFESRSPGGMDERLPALAAELVRLKVDLIVATGTPAIRAAKEATRTIPIVMVTDGDPVTAGLVASLARPGGNITGLTTLAPELTGKRLELLKEVVPKASRVAVLWNPGDPDKVHEWNELRAASRALEVKLQSLEVRSSGDLESAFAAAIREHADALLVLWDRLTQALAQPITDLAIRSRLPAIYAARVFVGPYGHKGLMSYAASKVDLSRRVAWYIDRILRGANPATLPVERPTRFELAINLKTAKALGLTIPLSLLVRADRVIR